MSRRGSVAALYREPPLRLSLNRTIFKVGKRPAGAERRRSRASQLHCGHNQQGHNQQKVSHGHRAIHRQ
jgi:hypothetical protein